MTLTGWQQRYFYALLWGKIEDRQIWVPGGKEVLPPQQHWTIQKAKFTYSPLVKAYEKQTKTIEKQWGSKLGPSIISTTDKIDWRYIFPKDLLNQEAKNELKRFLENEQKITKEDFLQ